MKVIPAHEKVDKSNVSNFRPISLLLSLSKLLEKVILGSLNHFFKDNNLFSKPHFEFCKKELTTPALVHATERI